ncbi:hypothetical protein LX32DRAFT_779 [Colletotrichum zoysiae]|uniref:Uncharacterized protein n=1 Tax=Colletotrichum zoysiae TaxID=1216348 RepID=A0AAD9M6Q1_9PEZI|nr:hypothetical protein LX32DRAFT_779 [Colletotrichum zoysiae]
MGSVAPKFDEPWSLRLLFRPPPPESAVGRTTGSRGLRVPKSLKEEGVVPAAAAASSPARRPASSSPLSSGRLASSSWSLARRRSAHFLIPCQAQEIRTATRRVAKKRPSMARMAMPMISAASFQVGGGAMAIALVGCVESFLWSWLGKTMVFLFVFFLE